MEVAVATPLDKFAHRFDCSRLGPRQQPTRADSSIPVTKPEQTVSIPEWRGQERKSFRARGGMHLAGRVRIAQMDMWKG